MFITVPTFFLECVTVPYSLFLGLDFEHIFLITVLLVEHLTIVCAHCILLFKCPGFQYLSVQVLRRGTLSLGLS
jgi:hypothetical protein